MKILLVIFLLFPVSIIFPQTDSTFQTDELLNSILEESTIDAEESQLYDLIEELLNNPVNINNASIYDLLKIPTIDLQTAQLIIKHRKEYGKYFSVHELFSIEELNKTNLSNIIPFLTVKEKVITEEQAETTELKLQYSINYRARFIEDIQERKGFVENIYEGSKYKFYNRLKGAAGNYKITILTEKDAGEKSLADFYSLSFSARKFYFIDKIILGDYLIEFGQGLAMWGPYSFSKGSEAVSAVSKNGRGIVEYTSSDENKFFRGTAAKINTKNFDFSFFYSSNDIDAVVEENKYITSAPIDGYHRTLNEISKKDNVNERIIGSIINFYPFKNSHVNFLYYNSNFSASFLPGRVYQLQGNHFNFYSLSYSTIFDRFYLSGEYAYNGLSAANINNLQLTINQTFSFVASIRSYPRNFYNLHSNGFGESSNTQNEFGIYTGIRVKLKSTGINFYYDQFNSPFATYSEPLSSKGHEFLIDIFHSFSLKTKVMFRYSNEEKEIYSKQTRQKIRFELLYNAAKYIRIKSRIEISRAAINNGNIGTGLLAFQDLRITPVKNLNIYSRLIFFDTDSYDTRIYEFENDLTGILSNTPLSGKGIKWYLLVNYNFLNNFKISAKYSELFQPELQELSSGLNEINGSFYNRLSFQVDFVF